MKKIVFLLMICIILLALVCCISDTPVSESSSVSSPEPTTKEPMASILPPSSPSPSPTPEIMEEPTSAPTQTSEPTQTVAPTVSPEQTPTPKPTWNPSYTVYRSLDLSQVREEALIVLEEAFMELPYIGYGVAPHEMNSEEILTIKYSDGNTTFAVTGEAYGPACFDVYDERIYIGNSYGHNVLVYEDGTLVKTIDVDGSTIYFIAALYVSNDGIILVDGEDYYNKNESVMIDFEG